MTSTPWDLEDIVDDEPMGGRRDHVDLLSEPYNIEVEDHYRFDPGRTEIEQSIESCQEVVLDNPERGYFLSAEKLEVAQAIEELQDAPDESDEDIHVIQPD